MIGCVRSSSVSHYRPVEMSKPGPSTATPVTYQFAQRPKELSFLEFVYNQETGEILGRTPVSWCKWHWSQGGDLSN